MQRRQKTNQIRGGTTDIARPQFNNRRRPEPDHIINERCLRHRDVRIVECDSALDGIYTSRRALDLAYEMGLDLVMVAPAANPPVCKITDYGKFKYDLSKQKKGEHDHKPKELKSLKISPLTALHDIEVQAKKATSFLTDGHRVKLICQFRARQLAHPEVGKEKMDALLALLAEAGKPEAPARLEGRMMTVLMIPCKK